MAGRFKIHLFAAVCLFACNTASAQELLSAGYGSSTTAVTAAGHCGPYQPSGHIGPPHPYGEYATAATVKGGVGYYDQDGLVTTRGPDYDIYLEKSPVEKLLERAVKNTWIRVEYVHFHFQEPGRELLGNDVTTAVDNQDDFFLDDFQTPPPRPVVDPRIPFVFLNSTNNVIGLFRALDLKRIGLRDNPGIRGTLGLPLTFGTLETSAFVTEHASDTIGANDLPGVTELPIFVPDAQPITDIFGFRTLFAVQPATLNNQPSTIMIPYQSSFRAIFETEIWGTEGNLVCDSISGHERFGLMPIIGFRYLNVFEELKQRGGNVGQITRIESAVHNRVFGPQFGLRAQLENPRWQLGVEGKVTLAANKYHAEVATSNLPNVFAPDEQAVANPTMSTSDEGTIFSPIGEFKIFGRCIINEHLMLFVSYDLTASAKISRPHDNIVYNFNGSPGQLVNDIHAEAEHRSFRFEGWTAGGEIRWK